MALDPGAGPRVGRVYGYVRVSTDRQSLSPEAQRERIKELARQGGMALDAVYQDAPVQNEDGSWNDAQSGGIPLRDRNVGGVLYGDLRKGDVVIAACIDRLFRSVADCANVLEHWGNLGVRLMVGDFPLLMDPNSPYQAFMAHIWAAVAQLHKQLTRLRTREALACRKRKQQSVNRFPGYGRKFERRYDHEAKKYVKVSVRDDEERALMKQLVEWRLKDHGWEQIASHLARLGVRTRAGVPWSSSRVRRAYKAELRYMAEEG